MKNYFSLALLMCLALPLRLGASGPELLGISFKQSQPSVDDDLAGSVEDPAWLQRTIDQDSRIMQRVTQIRYQIVGRADPSECADAQCNALALRRAQLFQDALVRSGVPRSQFCSPIALGPPWPPEYQAKREELMFARQAAVEPVFHGCAPNNSFKPTPLRGAA
jgi:hypothetical protein